MKKVISFSVYGENPKYTLGLIRNLELIEKIYPEWITYVYYNNTVPVDIMEKVNQFHNVESFDMTELEIPGMFWRFQPNELYEKMTDMNFLRDIIYPLYVQNSTVHAAYHGYEPWAKDFTSPLVDKRFIGEIINEDESREYHYTLI